MTPTEKAFAVAGGLTPVARALGISVAAVHKWRAKNQVPAERCLDMERLCRSTVTRYELRPDVFGSPTL